MKEELKAAASENTHETVLALISRENSGLVLDVGAGSGALSLKLCELGFKVVATDINSTFKANTIDEDIEFVLSDLDVSIPFKDHVFDYIVAVEIIEHVENPWHFLREISRVLKINGKLYLTTPNIHAIYQRIYFLFSRPFYSFRNYDFEENRHITPILFWNLKRMLDVAGFILKEITFNRGFIPKIKIRGKNLKAPKNFLFGETLILVAKKVNEPKIYWNL
ncbi:MAG: class I SAM-dependent methyltransferase [Promethearchaeota archaeon]